MKRTSRFIISALLASTGLTFSVSAQAGLFDALLAIPRMAIDVAHMGLIVPTALPKLILGIINVLDGNAGQKHNADRAGQFAVMNSYDNQNQKYANEATQALINEIFQGLHEFQSHLDAYKMPDKFGDCSNPNNPTCYSALSITSVNGSATIKDPAQQQAAKSYTSFASGSGSSLPAPDPNWTPTPQVIAYTNAYRNNTAAQSAQVNHVSSTLSNRLPADQDNSNVSSYEFNKNATYGATTSPDTQNVISSIPVVGWVYNISHGVTSAVSIAYHGSDQLDNLSNMTSSNTAMISQTQNQLTGRQMYHDALASQSGEPNKKGGQ